MAYQFFLPFPNCASDGGGGGEVACMVHGGSNGYPVFPALFQIVRQIGGWGSMHGTRRLKWLTSFSCSFPNCASDLGGGGGVELSGSEDECSRDF